MNLSISVRGWPGFWQYDYTGDSEESQHYTPPFFEEGRWSPSS